MTSSEKDGPWRYETAEAYQALSIERREQLEDKIWNMLYGDEAEGRPNSLVYFLSSLENLALGPDIAQDRRRPLQTTRQILEARKAGNPDLVFRMAQSEKERWENFSAYVGRNAFLAYYNKLKKDNFFKNHPNVELSDDEREQFEQIDAKAEHNLAEKREYERQSRKFATDRTYAWYLEKRREARGQKARPKRDSDFMEMQFTHGMKAEIHWFGENLWNREDAQEGKAIVGSFAPTSEVDDQFNHLDMTVTLMNEMTGYEPLVLGLDFTTRVDGGELDSKMGQLHCHGMNQAGKERLRAEREAKRKARETGGRFQPDRRLHRTLPDEQLIAELYPYPERRGANPDEYARAAQEVEARREQVRAAILDSDYNVTDEFTDGMGIPGFGYLDAMWDRATHGNDDLPKGDVPVVPRLVVGCSKDIMRMMMLAPEPQRDAPQYQGFNGKRKYDYDMESYNLKMALPRMVVRWCALLECRQQAHDIQTMVRELSEEAGQPGSPIRNQEEFELARKSIDQTVQYFDKCFDELVEQKQITLAEPDEELSETDPVYYDNPEQAAYLLALHDPVCAGIMRESEIVYKSHFTSLAK